MLIKTKEHQQSVQCLALAAQEEVTIFQRIQRVDHQPAMEHGEISQEDYANLH